MTQSIIQPAIDLNGVSVVRGGRAILDQITWQVRAGGYAAVIGPNGGGKSTLTRVLCGYLWPTRGQVTINGHRFGQTDLNQLRRSIRLVQAAGPYEVDPTLTARDAVLTGLFGTISLFDKVCVEDRSRADVLLGRVGLSSLADQAYSTLSSGERVRTIIARALISEPALLLLDEPTNGLDFIAREQVLAAVDALAEIAHGVTTVVLVTHHVEEISAAATQVLLLAGGKAVAAGPAAQVLQSEILSQAYGVTLQVRVWEGRSYIRVDPSDRKKLLDLSDAGGKNFVESRRQPV